MWVDGQPPPEIEREVKTVRGIIEFFKEHPDLAHYVRALGLFADLQSGSLLFGFTLLETSMLLELLQCLPFIQDLHLKNIAIRLGTDPVPTISPFPKLRQFSYTFWETIAGGPLQGTEDLLAPLRLFTEIDQLYLGRRIMDIVEPEVVPDHMVDLGHVRCRVRSVSLEAERRWMPKLLRGLRGHLDPTRLHTLELAPISFLNLTPDLAPVLHDFARSLKRLSLRISAPQIPQGLFGEFNSTTNSPHH